MSRIPEPRLTLVYRLEAVLGEPLDLGEVCQGHRRIVPQIGGTFAGPKLNGELLPGVSADWQIVLPDGTAIADIRYTLQTDTGALLYVQSRGVRHGSPEVLARLSRGEEVDASEYTFRTSTQIETASRDLNWLNKGVFISVGGRRPSGRDLRDLPGRVRPPPPSLRRSRSSPGPRKASAKASQRRSFGPVMRSSRPPARSTRPVSRTSSRCRVTSPRRRPLSAW